MANLLKKSFILFYVISIFSILESGNLFAAPKLTPNLKKTKLIGNMIKSYLESYHYRKIKIDDDVSNKAFKEFLKRMDYSKQFFLKSDIEKLSKYQNLMDNELVSGDFDVLELAQKILINRIKEVGKYKTEIIKKGFNFKKKEFLELDPEKRSWVKNATELKERWRKSLKNSVIGRYLSLKDDQNGDKKTKKKKKNKKHLSDALLKKKAIKEIDKKYTHLFKRLSDKRDEDGIAKFINSLTSIYDPHTTYLPPKRKEDFDIDISGSLEGIGAVLSEEDAYIKVVKIVPGGAAWRQKGLAVEDIILGVREGKDGELVDMVDMRVDDAVRYIRGKKGTEVRLLVKKSDGTRKMIPIIRDIIQVGESFAKSSVIRHENLSIKVGYIHLPKFYRDFADNKRNCTDDVRKEVERLKKSGVDGIILDLRSNGGGALEDAKLMSGLFIDKGPIVQVKNHDGKIEVLRDTDSKVLYDGPLIVMTNRFSASASEILAAAMQDYGRAIIVGGEHTHGKGTVQALVNLNQVPFMSLFGGGIGALKVTIQKFYRISGGSTQYKGVLPDIVIPDPFAYTKSLEKDLDYSLPYDEVPALNYTPWKRFSYHKEKLKRASKMRVSKNARFQKIVKSVDYLIKRSEDTLISLRLSDVIKRDEQNKKMTKEFKEKNKNSLIKVTNYEASLKSSLKIKKRDEKKWHEDFKQRKKEWVETLQEDAGLEEGLFIMNDIISNQKMIKAAQNN